MIIARTDDEIDTVDGVDQVVETVLKRLTSYLAMAVRRRDVGSIEIKIGCSHRIRITGYRLQRPDAGVHFQSQAAFVLLVMKQRVEIVGRDTQASRSGCAARA